MNVFEENSSFANNKLRTVIKKLDDICNWEEINGVAIEYHDLEHTVNISYGEVLSVKCMLTDYLKCIKGFEFIGINSGIPEYCVVSLILGILASELAFVIVPSEQKECTNIKDVLRIHYLFSEQITNEDKVVNKFTIHNKCIYLMECKDTRKQLMHNVKRNNYAYAISTSGSTGIPNVIKVPHSCIVPNILDLINILTIKKSDKIAQLTTFTFDPSIIEIFLALSTGGTLFMASKSLKNNSNRLLEKIYSNQITILQVTPSVLLYSWASENLKTTILSDNTSLRVLLLGGEPFPKIQSLLEIRHPFNTTKIYNIYGITEVSCWASINEIILKDDKFNIRDLGNVLSETIFQVKNEQGDIITNGAGFLYIGSKTRVCAINNENIEELMLPIFRDSGDLVEIDEVGKIFYKGRKGGVIKRFGNKVDLTQLENCALQVNFIKSCYIYWDETNHKLHLCLVAKEELANNSNLKIDMKNCLHKLDPLYRPDKIHFFKSFEYTAHGKISTEFLKEHCVQEEIMNKTLKNVEDKKIEEIFTSIWKDNLISVDEGFLKLGGTSIIALQISNAMSEVIAMEFPELIGMLLKDATLNECLQYIKNTVKNNPEEEVFSDCNYHPSNSQTIPLINLSPKSRVASENINTDTTTISNQTYSWCKCKGKTYGNIPFITETSKFRTISRLEVLKECDLKKCVDASPTVFQYSDGRTYATVGSHSGFISTIQLDEDCSSIFKVKLPDRIEASILILDDFKGVVGSYDGNIYCLHLKTGEIVWKYETKDIVKCTAICSEQRKNIFVGSYDSWIYCLSIKDGTEIWKIKGGNGSISASGCLHPLSTSVLFGTLDGTCLALEQSSGKIIWKHKLADPIFVAPVTLNNGLALFCSVTGTLSCFDIEVNVEMWRYKINGNVFSYIVKQLDAFTECENIIVASQNKNIYCLQLKDRDSKTEPSLKYVLNVHSPVFSTPWCEQNFLFIACTDGSLNIYNCTEDRLARVDKLPGDIFSSPTVHDNLLVVGCRDNNVYILRLVPSIISK